MSEAQESKYQDDSDHLLSNKCVVNESPLAQEAWSDFKEKLSRTNKDNIILSEVVNDDYRIRFVLNPTCMSLGQNRIKPDDLQAGGLDVILRKYCYYKLKHRYNLLKEKGFITRKRF